MKIIKTNERQYIQSPFKRKKSKRSCKVCGNASRFHCSETEDGGLALCKYKWSDKLSKDGRYIHILNPDLPLFPNLVTPIIHKSEPKRADAETCNSVYTALLSHLKL